MMDAREFNAYRQQTAVLARKAIALVAVGDGGQADEPTGLAHAATAAQMLLGDDVSDGGEAVHAFAEALREATGRGERLRVTDPAGHWRDVYALLAMHLQLQAAARLTDGGEARAALGGAVIAALADEPCEMHLALWRALCLHEAGLDTAAVRQVVERVLAQPGNEGTLHAMTAEDSLDAWTWRELLGLHALGHLCFGGGASEGNDMATPKWRTRLREACEYHLMTTQPDHVTTQPWGLTAFVCDPQMATFAGQQLHDAATQIALAEGRPIESKVGGGAFVAGLLLADVHALLARMQG